MSTVYACAHSNIALVKYWGKRTSEPADLNLPAVSSLSMTLATLRTETRLSEAQRDEMVLNSKPADPDTATKAFRHLDRIWQRVDGKAPRLGLRIETQNHLPTAAGLASSASGFAALTLAGAAYFGLDLDREGLSGLARQGSGSAARSLWGGFVALERGHHTDGRDCRAYQLHDPDHWDLRLLIVHTSREQKPIGSTGGMERSRSTSPYYPAWVESSQVDFERSCRALADRNFSALGEIMEHSCFKMHACMWATVPPLAYWNGATLDVIRAIWAARSEGVEAYVTSDAGPHVKVLCRPPDARFLTHRLLQVQGVAEVQSVGPGPDPVVEVSP